MSNEMRKLLEAVEQLNEEWVEYRDPAGHFQVVYQPPRGYFVVTQRHLPDISGESFDDVEDAIEHAHDSLGVDYLDDDVNEDFAEEPMPYDEFHMGSILDREEAPAIPLRIKALDDVPMLYMKQGDEMWLKPTNIMGEVYSEENGLTYDWDHIFHMYSRGMLEIIPDENEFNDPGEMEPYVEEAAATSVKATAAMKNKALKDVSAVVDSLFPGLFRGEAWLRPDLPSVVGVRLDTVGSSEEIRQVALQYRRKGLKKADLQAKIEDELRSKGYTFFNPFPGKNPVRLQIDTGGLGSDDPHVAVAVDFEGESIYKRASMDQEGNVQKTMVSENKLNEYNLDDFGTDELVEQLAQNIAQDVLRNMNLTHKTADAVRRHAPEMGRGMAAKYKKELDALIDVHIQALVDEYVDNPENE